MALILLPPRPMTRLMADAGTATFLTRYVGLVDLKFVKQFQYLVVIFNLLFNSLYFMDTYLRTTSFHSSSARLLLCLLPLEEVLAVILPMAAALLVLEKETVLETLDAVIIVLFS